MSVFVRTCTNHGPARLAPAGGLQLTTLARRLERYGRLVANRYRLITPETIRAELTPGPCWVSPKLDGQLWFLVKEHGEVALCAPDGRVLLDAPLVREAARALLPCGDTIIAGELTVPAGSGRARVHTVARAFEDPRLVPMMRFDAFDLLREGDQEFTADPYDARLDRMRALLGGGTLIDVVPTVELGDPEAVASCYQEWVGTGRAAGLIVRDQYGLTSKIKPSVTLQAVIVGFGERRTERAGVVADLVLALRRDEGYLQILGTVSRGLRELERASWYPRLMNMVVPSAHLVASSQGTLCRFVRPEIIVEITCDELRARHHGGAEVRTAVIDHSREAGYTRVGEMPLVRLKNPVFHRERPDLLDDVAHIGLEQVYSVLPFGGRRDIALPTTLPRAEVLRREVYTRTSDDIVRVRKVVALRTHKDRLDPDHPPYAVHFTDFSPERAEPLKTSVRVASNLTHLNNIIDEWLAENIKRGWEPAGATA